MYHYIALPTKIRTQGGVQKCPPYKIYSISSIRPGNVGKGLYSSVKLIGNELAYELLIPGTNEWNHENPTTLDSASLRPEFARPTGSGQIFRMPEIEKSLA